MSEQTEIKIDPVVDGVERETTIVIEKDRVLIFSSHRTGIKWCLARVEDNTAELKNKNVNSDGSINSISIETQFDLISLKSIPRKQNNISNVFSI